MSYSTPRTRVNWTVRRADHSPASSARGKNSWRYTYLPLRAMMWHLIKHRENFTFYITQSINHNKWYNSYSKLADMANKKRKLCDLE